MTLTSTQLRELKAHASIRSGGVPTDEVRDAEAALIVALRNELPRIIADRELAEACERLDLSGLRDRTSPFSNGLSTHELAVLAIKMSIGDACGYCGNPSPKCYCWNDE